MKIFYSWQSDLPRKIGKNFIRSALDRALDEISKAMELQEAERLLVDQDTQGVLGSPQIAETIFQKIRESDVVVLDVTLVGKTASDKKLLNSNVSYEYGFAHGTHGDKVILCVMNTHFGMPEELPFDLKHRRWPLSFNLSPESTNSEIKAGIKTLADQLVDILTKYFDEHRTDTKHIPIQSTSSPGAYWENGEKLVDVRDRQGLDAPFEFGYEDGHPLTYLRIWPDTSISEFTGRDLTNWSEVTIPPLLGIPMGHSWERNRFGTITYAQKDGVIQASTQVFKTREIWGVDAVLLCRKEGYDFEFIPTQSFVKGMRDSLNLYLRKAFESFGYPDHAHVEAGLIGVAGFKLALGGFDGFSDRIYDDIIVRSTVKRGDEASIDAALGKIVADFYDAAGLERPRN